MLLGLMGWIADSMAYIVELVIYGIHAVWITLVKATVAFLEALDEIIPGMSIADNALFRALVMAGVGFLIGVVLMVFLSFITGNWGIPCVFTLAIGFCAFVGLIADPDGDWSFGDFPTFGRGSSPKTPLNL